MTTRPTFDLLQETVGKPLKKVIEDLGCPTLPGGLITREHRDFLHFHIDNLPDDDATLDQRVLEGALNGKVLRAGVSPAGHNLLSVRLPLNKAACIITFAFYQDTWTLHHIESVQTRLNRISRLFVGALMGAAVTAICAYFLIGSGSGNIVAEAKSKGYVVLTQQQYEDQLLHPSADSAAPAKDAKGADKQADKKDGETITFTMQDGMTTDDLTSFLKDKGLIDDKAAFNQELTQKGIDTMIRPKDYEFKKGMTQDELLAVLQG